MFRRTLTNTCRAPWVVSRCKLHQITQILGNALQPLGADLKLIPSQPLGCDRPGCRLDVPALLRVSHDLPSFHPGHRASVGGDGRFPFDTRPGAAGALQSPSAVPMMLCRAVDLLPNYLSNWHRSQLHIAVTEVKGNNRLNVMLRNDVGNYGGIAVAPARV